MEVNGNDLVLFRPGPKDLLAVFFYTLVMILAHAIIQEFCLDVCTNYYYFIATSKISG